MVNGFCFGGAFTQVAACDFAIAADDAIFGLSEVNWGILPGGIVSWNVTQLMNFRNAMYYAVTGDPFNGKRAADIGYVNYSVPKAKLKAETVKLAKKLMEKNPTAMRYTKEAIRSVRFMNEPEAADYLNCKSDALKYMDKEKGREHGMKQFLDDKTYRPGLGQYDRKRAQKENQKGGAKPAAAAAQLKAKAPAKAKAKRRKPSPSVEAGDRLIVERRGVSLMSRRFHFTDRIGGRKRMSAPRKRGSLKAGFTGDDR